MKWIENFFITGARLVMEGPLYQLSSRYTLTGCVDQLETFFFSTNSICKNKDPPLNIKIQFIYTQSFNHVKIS